MRALSINRFTYSVAPANFRFVNGRCGMPLLTVNAILSNQAFSFGWLGLASFKYFKIAMFRVVISLVIIIIIGYTLSVALAAASGLVGNVGLRVGSGAFFA